ncbi:parietopsin [Osmerus mordax]|uniref:parietopsin n=1 Tax=Osmerus mordax TaxID=8014 RepID=UPI00350F4753
MDSNTTSWSVAPTLLVTGVPVAPTIFPRVGYSIISYIMFINTIFSVFNNSIVITVMLKNSSLINAMNLIILSLAVSDLMIALCGSLIVTITNYHGSFFLGEKVCTFQGFAVNYFGLVSLNTLTLLAYERYIVVCRPMAGFKLNVRRSCHGLLFVWLFCLFWAVAPLLGWSSYGPEGVQTSCSLGWEERSWSNYSYLILYTLLCFILPVIIIIYCYSKVLAYMKKLNRSVELQGGQMCLEENEKAVRMVTFMIVAFFICWLPYTALSVVVVVNPELQIPPLVATMPMYFAKTSPVYNPIIYFLSNKQFREATLEALSCGQYIPRGPASKGIGMISMRRSRMNQGASPNSKVLPM